MSRAKGKRDLYENRSRDQRNKKYKESIQANWIYKEKKFSKEVFALDDIAYSLLFRLIRVSHIGPLSHVNFYGVGKVVTGLIIAPLPISILIIWHDRLPI